MENCLHEIILYVLSCFLPSVNKDLQIQKDILLQINKKKVDLDLDLDLDLYINTNTKSYEKFRNQYK